MINNFKSMIEPGNNVDNYKGYDNEQSPRTVNLTGQSRYNDNFRGFNYSLLYSPVPEFVNFLHLVIVSNSL